MTTGKICFDGQAYARAVADMNRAGYTNIKNELDFYKDSYECLEEGWKLYFVEPRPASPNTSIGQGSKLWLDSKSVAHWLIEINSSTVKYLAGFSKSEARDPNMVSLKELYECELEHDTDCVETKVNELSARNLQEKAATARANAEKEIKEVEDCIKRTNAYWDLGRRLVSLARECDISPGGIEWEDLDAVMRTYAHSKPNYRPTTKEEACDAASNARAMVDEMLEDPSGYNCVKERGSQIGCSFSKWTGSSPSCKSDEDSYPSRGISASCDGDVYASMSIQRSAGGCSKKQTEKRERMGGSWR